MRRFTFPALALASLVALALLPVAAHAGGAHVRVHEATRAGGRLRLELIECGAAGGYAVRAEADTWVGGKRRTVALRATPAPERGWMELAAPAGPAQDWVLRVRPLRGHAPTTVVAVRADGRLGERELVWDGDGRREASRLLAMR